MNAGRKESIVFHNAVPVAGQWGCVRRLMPILCRSPLLSSPLLSSPLQVLESTSGYYKFLYHTVEVPNTSIPRIQNTTYDCRHVLLNSWDESRPSFYSRNSIQKRE